MNHVPTHLTVIIIAVAGFLAAMSAVHAADTPAASQRFFEMRVYTTAEGRLDALHARFRDHTNTLFRKHGIEIIGFWTPADEPRSKNTLIYILAYPSREAREQSWKEFQADPEWQKAKADSEKDGKIVVNVDSTYMTPTDFRRSSDAASHRSSSAGNRGAGAGKSRTGAGGRTWSGKNHARAAGFAVGRRSRSRISQYCDASTSPRGRAGVGGAHRGGKWLGAGQTGRLSHPIRSQDHRRNPTARAYTGESSRGNCSTIHF